MKNSLFWLIIITNLAYSKDITIFAHGIIDSKTQVNRFKDAINTPNIEAINFSDSLSPSSYNPIHNLIFSITSYFGKNMNLGAMFMGQKDDITTIKKAIESIDINNKAILFGCSRGAATIVSYLGQFNPENISAVVLDATPANMPNTIKIQLAKTGINPDYSDTIFSHIFPNYDITTALTPLDAVPKIKNKDLPIILLLSQEDKIVHHTNSLILYQAFKDNGFTNVHLVILPKGRHSFVLQNESVREDYLTAINNFYKKYDLPYNQEFISESFQENVPTKEEIDREVANYTESINNIFKMSYQRNLTIAMIGIMLAIAYKTIKD